MCLASNVEHDKGDVLRLFLMTMLHGDSDGCHLYKASDCDLVEWA